MGSGCLIEGVGGLSEGGGLFDRGFNIGFTAYFTIIEVKKIIRRFFISRLHCIRAYPYIVFLTKKYFFSVTFAGSLWQISQGN